MTMGGLVRLGEDTRLCLDEWYQAFLRDDCPGMEAGLRDFTATLPLKRRAKKIIRNGLPISSIMDILERAKYPIKGVLAHDDWPRYVEFMVLMGWLYETTVSVFGNEWYPGNRRSYYKWAVASYDDAIDSIEQFCGVMLADWQKWSRILAEFYEAKEKYALCASLDKTVSGY